MRSARGTCVSSIASSVVVLLALAGCTDWDSTPTKLAREMRRIGYGCNELEPAAGDLDQRGITSAGTCIVNGQLIVIEKYKDGAALEADRTRRDNGCRRAPQPDRGFLALPYVRKGNAIIEGVFLNAYDRPPAVVASAWDPIASGIAAATKGQVTRPDC
jgi:hypothetical protein